MAFSDERGERYSFGQTPYADKPDTGRVPVAKEFGALNDLSRHFAEDACTLSNFDALKFTARSKMLTIFSKTI